MVWSDRKRKSTHRRREHHINFLPAGSSLATIATHLTNNSGHHHEGSQKTGGRRHRDGAQVTAANSARGAGSVDCHAQNEFGARLARYTAAGGPRGA